MQQPSLDSYVSITEQGSGQGTIAFILQTSEQPYQLYLLLIIGNMIVVNEIVNIFPGELTFGVLFHLNLINLKVCMTIT